MAKLTVFFKYKAIQSNLFENGIVHIGRDETNDLAIDSLAVAPAHAAIIIHDGVSKIKQLNENFPLIVNGETIKECNLKDNDMISLGKHHIVYNTTESVLEPQPTEIHAKTGQSFIDHEVDDVETNVLSASLQIINGTNIGKVLALKKPITRLGQSGNGVIAISKRKDGYYVSSLENVGTVLVNNQPLGNNSHKLQLNDILVINNTALQFFFN